MRASYWILAPAGRRSRVGWAGSLAFEGVLCVLGVRELINEGELQWGKKSFNSIKLKRQRNRDKGGESGAWAEKWTWPAKQTCTCTCSCTAALLLPQVVGSWWLVVGGWWLVVSGRSLAVWAMVETCGELRSELSCSC
jgi:hypothetical protein